MVKLTTMNVVMQLIQLGLTQKQVQVYLFLVEHREARIGDITSGAGMPRSSVYQNLKGLRELGLVEEVVEQKIVRYKAYPISILRHSVTEKLALIDEVGEGIQKLSELAPNVLEVRSYRGVTGARQLFWNTLKAKGETLVYSAYGRSKFVGRKFYADFVTQSRSIPIQEKVLINPTKHSLEMIHQDTGSILARTQTKDIKCIGKNVIPIYGETFIYNNIYAVIYLKNREISGFEIESTEFVTTQRAIFLSLWNQAKPLSITQYG